MTQCQGNISVLLPTISGNENSFISKTLLRFRESTSLGAGILQLLHACLVLRPKAFRNRLIMAIVFGYCTKAEEHRGFIHCLDS